MDNINNMDNLRRITKAYDAKIATGKYKNYDDEMLAILMQDCVRECYIANEINKKSKGVR